MNSFIEFGEKKFKAATNIVFVFALIIISGQIIETGFPSLNIGYFLDIFKAFNLVFSILSFIMSWYLYITTTNFFIKLARIIFLLISLSYFVITIIWLTGFFNRILDVEGFRLFLALFIGFIAVSIKVAGLGSSSIHPALIFVLSFILLIILGTFTLMLPAAAYTQVSFLEALFTATSAVTVTGLTILDTGKDFTLFGQTVILILIQLGGLGVLTITNIFALIFKTSSSFKNRMMVSDMIKELNNKNTFSTLFKIISLTVLVEMLGAILIYFTVAQSAGTTENHVFFSLFHAISAFCNAGFSTLSASFYEESVRFNYSLQLIVVWLIITGGLGYSVMINHYILLKNFIIKKLSYIKSLGIVHNNILTRTTTNSRIVLVTTSILLVSGTILFMISEYDGTLKDHSFFGKIVVSFFNSSTPRTAGFNNINMAEMGIPAFMLTLALMWIGASPGSTGGGIKTTTFAVALLNLWNQIRGREQMVVKMKEIPHYAINQVNAVILLSIFAISFGTFLLAFLNPGIAFNALLFECISAYSTVGLSVGITAQLSHSSQIFLIILMFLGRVSFLTFLTGIFSQIFGEEKGCDPYYPKENVFIN
jgi:potassium uptake TrkH family protein